MIDSYIGAAAKIFSTRFSEFLVFKLAISQHDFGPYIDAIMDTYHKEVTWNAALRRLRNGNTRYHRNTTEDKPNEENRRATLVAGQHPFAIILTCTDSRVVPEFIFDAGIGELFVVRVAGNVANSSSIASIEFAVVQFGVRLIVVMGHESCGAVEAAFNGSDLGDNLNHLLAYIKPAVGQATHADVDAVSRINCRNSAQVLVRESDYVREAVDTGDVRIVPAFYNLGSGVVDFDDRV